MCRKWISLPRIARCLSLLACAVKTAPLNNRKYDTYRSCNVFSDVKAFRKQTARPVKLWMETLVEEETLGESRDIIKIYSCSFLQWDSRWFSSPIQWVLYSLWGKSCLGVKLITHLPLRSECVELYLCSSCRPSCCAQGQVYFAAEVALS
jgi:hypothetical protein